MYCSEAALIFCTQAVLGKQSTAFAAFPRTSQVNQEPKLGPALLSLANLGLNKFPIADLIFAQLKDSFAEVEPIISRQS